MKIKKLFIALIICAYSSISYGQVASDGLNNATSLFTLTGGAYYTGNSAAADGPSSSPFASEGTHSRGVSSASATLSSGNIDASSYTGISATFRLASFSLTNATNGADGADIVTVEISPNGGTNYYSTVRVLGNTNARWPYTATGVASTAYDGNATPVDFAPAAGGNRTTDGYSTVTITGLPAVTNLRVRITLLNDNANERWVIDDFQVLGTLSTLCSTPTSQATDLTSNGVTTTTANLSWTDGASTSGTLVALRLTASANATPTSGTNYTPTLTFNTAAGANLINAANVVVAKNNTGSVTGISGLAAGTQYTATPYAYNGSGTNVCFNTTNPESFNFYTLALEPTASPASITCGPAASTVTNIPITFSAANTITNANGYLVVYKEGSPPTNIIPVDGVSYPSGATFGDVTVATPSYIGSAVATTATITGLNGGTTYYFALIPFGSNGVIAETLNYRVTTPTIRSCSTQSAPEINVRGVIGANPTILDNDTTPSSSDNTLYGTVVVASPQDKTFKIENTGNLALTVSSINMVGGNNTDFTALTTALGAIPFPLSIAAGASYDFVIRFTPGAAGTRNTTVTIANNDNSGTENPYTFVVEGMGTLTPLVEINVKGNGQSIPNNTTITQGTNWTAFPVTLQGGSSTRTFTIENLGTTVLSLTGAPLVQVSGPNASLFTITTAPSSSIAGNASTTFIVTFSPTSGGSKNATLTIANNDSDENPYVFNISGTCQGLSNINVTGNSYDVPKGSTTTSTTNLTDFGLVAVTTGVKQNTFIITNLSTSSRYLSNVTVSGADASMFTVIAQPNNNAIGAGNSTSVTVNFTPTSAGVKNATLTFNAYTNSTRTTSDPTDPIYTFAVSGEGISYIPCSNNAVQTIAIQDFEAAPATPTMTYAAPVHDGNLTTAGGTFNNGSGALNGFIGARSLQFKGTGSTTLRTAVITFNPVDVSQYTNINLSMRVGAFRVSGTTQGLDIDDLIQIETSTDGGTTWLVQSILKGYSNSRWSFAATGSFNAYYNPSNTPVTLDTRNGDAELSAGISTYSVRNLPAVTALSVRVTMKVDRTDELWALDDIKIEGQTAQSTTWNGASWSAGFPTPTTKAIFDGNYTTTAAVDHGSVEACECEIKAGRNVTVDSGYYMEIQSNITNSGNLTIANNGSLVQVNDVAVNTGNITYERTPTGIRGFDYIYWSSPVTGQSIDNLYLAPPPGQRYRWSTLASNVNSPLSSGNWVTTSGSMSPGSGYIMRACSWYALPASSIPAVFTGSVNNGVLPVTIYRGGNTIPSSTGAGNSVTVTNFDDNWNLVGNPYPSSINAINFLNANTDIQGFVYLWTHASAPTSTQNPFYSSFVYNYYDTDYITYNSVGSSSGPSTFNGYIAGGQGFFVMMNDGASGSGTINFKNNLRSKSYDNSQFYKNSITGDDERHRIWLDLVDANNASSRTLVGYASGATTGLDRMYDAFKNTANEFNIYSLADSQTLTIQGRPTPFDSNDTVPIGVRIMTNGTYRLAIAAVDGLFSEPSQDIFIEDKLLGIIHNLRLTPYSFDATAGIINDRFLLRYNDSALGNPEFETGTIILTSNQGQMGIKSSVENILEVAVYDILGRQLFEAKSIGNKDFRTSEIKARQQTLIVKIKLEDGSTVTRKIIL